MASFLSFPHFFYKLLLLSPFQLEPGPTQHTCEPLLVVLLLLLLLILFLDPRPRRRPHQHPVPGSHPHRRRGRPNVRRNARPAHKVGHAADPTGVDAGHHGGRRVGEGGPAGLLVAINGHERRSPAMIGHRRGVDLALQPLRHLRYHLLLYLKPLLVPLLAVEPHLNVPEMHSANALLDFSTERFVLLAESCIPVFKFPTVYKYLMDSSYSFMQSFDENSNQGHKHYNNLMGPEIKLSQWRKGSQWFEVQHSLAIHAYGCRKEVLLYFQEIL